LAIGDAIGTTLEFRARDTYEALTDMVGGGPSNLKVGEWTDDTAMELALSDSLEAREDFENRTFWADL
jgi:ADP-ribosyl-[dinitrogen reductase] hydrolase